MAENLHFLNLFRSWGSHLGLGTRVQSPPGIMLFLGFLPPAKAVEQEEMKGMAAMLGGPLFHTRPHTRLGLGSGKPERFKVVAFRGLRKIQMDGGN